MIGQPVVFDLDAAMFDMGKVSTPQNDAAEFKGVWPLPERVLIGSPTLYAGHYPTARPPGIHPSWPCSCPFDPVVKA
jgi:hypothetical protein